MYKNILVKNTNTFGIKRHLSYIQITIPKHKTFNSAYIFCIIVQKFKSLFQLFDLNLYEHVEKKSTKTPYFKTTY